MNLFHTKFPLFTLFILSFCTLISNCQRQDLIVESLSFASFPWDEELSHLVGLSLRAFQVASREILLSNPSHHQFITKLTSQIGGALLVDEDFHQALKAYLKMFARGTLFFHEISNDFEWPSLTPVNTTTGDCDISKVVFTRFECIFAPKIIKKAKTLGISSPNFAIKALVYSCSDAIVNSIGQIDPFGIFEQFLASKEKNSLSSSANGHVIRNFINLHAPETIFNLQGEIITFYCTLLMNLKPSFQRFVQSGNLTTSLLLWRILQFMHSNSRFCLSKLNNHQYDELTLAIVKIIKRQSTFTEATMHQQVLKLIIQPHMANLIVQVINSMELEEFIKCSQLIACENYPGPSRIRDAWDYGVASFAFLACVGIAVGWGIHFWVSKGKV